MNKIDHYQLLNSGGLKTKQWGFTMIEILVVITIIGILVTLGLGSFMSSQAKARDGQRKSDLKQITTALEAYYNDHGGYPESNDAGNLKDDEGNVLSWGDEFSDSNNTVYMPKLPSDPSGARAYFYNSSGPSYYLYARLENTQDLEAKEDGYDGTDCGDAVCNYGVTSSNVSLE
ncbi:MAG: prepilin-type N-terminal cleavage/methylation domain-containing protein [Candidatus Pacebacteria bacterium]|nr:prepilin-type N-terminal cleavage/methylation domain-containing protein [Candidatus Paceibacterota bacterium]